MAASRTLVISSSGTASGFNRRNARAVYITSKRLISVIFVMSLRRPRWVRTRSALWDLSETKTEISRRKTHHGHDLCRARDALAHRSYQHGKYSVLKVAR